MVVDARKPTKDVGGGIEGGAVVLHEGGLQGTDEGGLPVAVALEAGGGESDDDGALVIRGAFARDVSGSDEPVDKLGGGGVGGLGGGGKLGNGERSLVG